MEAEENTELRAVLAGLLAPLTSEVAALRRELRDFRAVAETRVDHAADAAMKAEAQASMVADHMAVLRDAIIGEISQHSAEALRLRTRIDGHLATVVREVTEGRRTQAQRYDYLEGRIAILEAESAEGRR